MKTTRDDTWRAKRISCVTISIVVPASARPRMVSEHFLDELRIESRGHLVEEQQARVHRERPCDRDALLLSAGKRRGIVVAARRRGRRGRASARQCARASCLRHAAAPWSGRA